MFDEGCRHTNVVGTIGVSFDAERIPILIMELMNGGCLEDYLKDNVRSSLKIPTGNVFDHQASIRKGGRLRNALFAQLQYHSSRFGGTKLHVGFFEKQMFRLTDALKLKISDFGLARECSEDDPRYMMQNRRPMPVRWLAPEAFFENLVMFE